MNASSYQHRVKIGFFAALAFLIALYLGLCQLRIFHAVWDPFFGTEAKRVLHSPLTAILPIPDALLGAIAYAAEIILLFIGDERRAVTRPWVVLLYFCTALAIGLTGVGLVSYQSFVLHQWCTLCLVTGAISISLVFPAYQEGKKAIAFIFSEHREEISW